MVALSLGDLLVGGDRFQIVRGVGERVAEVVGVDLDGHVLVDDGRLRLGLGALVRRELLAARVDHFLDRIVVGVRLERLLHVQRKLGECAVGLTRRLFVVVVVVVGIKIKTLDMLILYSNIT